MGTHTFGGDWTEDKLERVRKYLVAYTKIFKRNPRAQYYTTVYVDAFAGTGEREGSRKGRTKTRELALQITDDQDAQELRKGSARIALEVRPPFDSFLFIEQNAKRIKELEKLRTEFSDQASGIRIEPGDANEVLKRWCRDSDWQKQRAVVFLDPYGMQVEWSTIEAIAGTQAIDLWVLFPLGMAVNRLLTRKQPPPKPWAEALTRFFGTEEWRDQFYPKKKERLLFEEEESERKAANFKQISDYFLKRLKSVFAEVAPKPLVLENSNGVPIYLLCFAAGNPKGAPTAVRIAKDILKR